MKRAYETMYILRPDMGEEMADQVITKYQGILKDNGVESIDTQHRGKRRLAYEIQNHKEGIYIQMNYEAEPAAVAAMERDMRFSEDIIRFLTMRQDELQSDPSTPVSL
ncbi:30S ribosomal protein S6 [Leptolyngbya sp. CCY15150]|uniref:30S ribosomal protein S6 n=1 Tax=Leptolyngbya sp. CCY15150 TaxID=2767772 RepID=UPI001951B960|nr:30S ribosomal protein S6 [Leptolyngbya sp. CCY15150]